MGIRIFFGFAVICCIGIHSHCRASPADTTRKYNPLRVLILADTGLIAQQARTEKFYKNLRDSFYRTKLTRQLYDLVFESNPTVSANRAYVEPVQNEFIQYDGKVIGKIKFKSLPLFGPTVYDTTRTPNTWYGRAGNKIHISTQDYVIRKNLLFEEGEKISAEMLSDNERLLRRLNFIRDARIYIESRATTTDTVDIAVVTQDVFPLELGGSRNKIGDYGLNLNNNNVLGYGHQLENTLVWTADQKPNLGYIGIYRVQNVFGTFMDAEFNYHHYPLQQGARISLQRAFLTPDTKWAGGAMARRYLNVTYLSFLDSARDSELRYNLDQVELWGGRSFALANRKRFGEGRTNLIVAANISRLVNAQPTGSEIGETAFFTDRKRLLGSIGITRQLFRRDRYLYGFGRTEDVPLGAYFNLTVGQERLPETTQPLMQLSAAWGGHRNSFGYLFAKADYTSFKNTSQVAGKELHHAQLSYISNLIPIHRYRLRQIFKIDALNGRNRFDYEYLTVSDNQVPGARGQFARGTQRLTVHAETIAFTPLEILGFRVAGLAFADLAWINQNEDFLTWKGNNVQGFGMGIRVKNENLVFRTFELRATYYPASTGLSRTFFLNVSGLSLNRFLDFRLGKPELYPFR